MSEPGAVATGSVLDIYIRPIYPVATAPGSDFAGVTKLKRLLSTMFPPLELSHSTRLSWLTARCCTKLQCSQHLERHIRNLGTHASGVLLSRVATRLRRPS